MTVFQEIFSNLYVIALLASVLTYLFSTKLHLYPIIISVAKKKGLMDVPGERSTHKAMVPRLGGVGLFISFSLPVIVAGLLFEFDYSELIKLLSLTGSAIILLFLGIKDDLVSMSPKKKFIGQLIAVANVIVLSDIRIMSFEGLLGIYELPYLMSVLFTVFVFILVINATNLIDGIDGLAGSIGLISSAVFGAFFLFVEQQMMAIVSFVLIGSIIGFLKYNFSKTYKIFMGDCGSMFMGFLLVYQGILFLTYNNEISPSGIANAPIVLLAILSYPLLDTLRVFIIRIRQNRSPFSADQNHMHHHLIRIGLNHKMATLFLTVSNALVIGLAFLLGDLNINIQLVICVTIGSAIYLTPFLIRVKKAALKKTVEPNGEDPLGRIVGGVRTTKVSHQSDEPFATINELANLNFEVNNTSSQLVEENSSKIKKPERPKISLEREEKFRRPVKKL